MTALLLDICVAAFILIMVRNGARKGLVKSIWRLAAWILTIALVFVLSKPVVNILSKTALPQTIYGAVHTVIDERMSGMDINALNEEEDAGEAVSDASGIPNFLMGDIFPGLTSLDIKESINNSVSGMVDYVSQSATALLIKITANLLLFAFIRILLAVLFRALNLISKLPVINGANRLLGAFLGFVNVMLVIYLLCAVIYLALSVNTRVYDIISDTYLIKYFYNHNILLQLFMKM